MAKVTKDVLLKRLQGNAVNTPLKGATKEAFEVLLSLTLSELGAALAGGENVELRGFGTFTIKERKARTGRNIKTGEPVPVPARKGIRFKASPDVVKQLNKKQ